LRAITGPRGLALVADAAHALGAKDQGVAVGSLADLSAFSLHPVKPITAGEGGVVTTDDVQYAARMRRFRDHGIDRESSAADGPWHYEMRELGYNYRLTDLQCALACSQLTRLDGWIARRQAIARRYDRALAVIPGLLPLAVRCGVSHAYHLYVVRLDPDRLGLERRTLFAALRSEGIGVGVHYLPPHLHPFYRQRFSTEPGLCPVAEAAYENMLTLPLFPAMTDGDVEAVVAAMRKVVPSCRE
jgi:perosamine synthetase